MFDETQPVTERARRFGRQLEGRYTRPVHWADERLSSREAIERLHALGEDPHENDAMAACVILETWFGEAALRTEEAQ